jgi:hypothetical protein
MGCNQTKGVEKSWEQPRGPLDASDTTEALVVTHARTKLTEIGAPMLDASQYRIIRFLQEGG